MTRRRYHLHTAGLLAVALTGSLLIINVHGCSTEPPERQVQQAVGGEPTPI